MRERIHDGLEKYLLSGDETAFVYQRGLRTERWSYRKIATTAYQFAQELEARGIGPDDRVIFWSENCPEWVAAFYGCSLRGAVVVPLDEQSAPDFAQRVQNQVEARLLLCGREQKKHFKGKLDCLLLDELSENMDHHRQPATGNRQPATDPRPQTPDLVEIIFTSGTTAEPKGVCLTHRNLLANLDPLETEIGKYRRWERPFHPLRIMCLLPLSHVFGQFMGVFIPQLLKGEVFFQATLNPSEIIAQIKRERISVVAAVPRQLETLREKLERDFAAQGKLEKFRERFKSAEGRHFLKRWWMFRAVHQRFGWKFWAFVSGGATLDEETERFWQRLGFAVVQGYGMTETASLVSVNHPFKLSRGSIGKTLPGQEVKLDENGEILVRGANVSAGYWRVGVQSLKSDEGWLRTGDVGAFDAEGNLFFKGRQKDVIVTAAGLNLYPEDLEAALNQQPEVRASCVIGVDLAAGPEAMAVLILRDSQVDPEVIVKRANQLLNQSQQMRRWFVWREPDFPRTPTHKVRKPIVSEIVKAQSANSQGSNQSAPRSGSLSELVVAVGDDGSPKPNSVADLSQLDSLGRVQLLSAIEDRYQVELDEAAITPTTTLSELEKMIQTSAPAAHSAHPDRPLEYPYPSWARSWPARWLRFMAYYLLVFPFVMMMCRPRVKGREKLKRLKGPVLFISNHISMIDPAMILFALPWKFKHRLAIAMAGERLRGLRHLQESGSFLDFIKYLLVVLVFNVFPLPQKSGFRRSFSFAGEAVDRGFHLLVFPEGRTTEDGRMNQFMSGIGLLVEKLEIAVVPLKIEGLFDLTEQRRYFSRPGTVTVVIGEPVSYERGIEPETITKDLHARVTLLN